MDACNMSIRQDRCMKKNKTGQPQGVAPTKTGTDVLYFVGAGPRACPVSDSTK